VPPVLMTTEEVAELLRIKTDTVRKYVRAGSIPRSVPGSASSLTGGHPGLDRPAERGGVGVKRPRDCSSAAGGPGLPRPSRESGVLAFLGTDFADAARQHRLFSACPGVEPAGAPTPHREHDRRAGRPLVETVCPRPATRTRPDYQGTDRAVYPPLHGDLPLRAQTPDTLRGFRTYLESQPGRKGRNLSPSTVRQVLG